MSQLTVRCLGGLEVRRDERLITGFESHKVKALFVYLVVRRDLAFSRDHLAGLLWPEKPDDTARRNLRQAIYNLKSVLGLGTEAPILTQGGELRLNPAIDCWLDAEAFLAARKRGTSSDSIVPHDLAAAVALYRGDFLAGFSLKDSPDFELWMVEEQEHLRDQAVEILRLLIDNYLSRGEFRLGIQYSRRLVTIDPLSEHAHRYLIRLYSLSGRRSRALAEYERLRETLHRELGVEPLDETRELYEQVLRDYTLAPGEEDRQGLGPLIPLVGRHHSYQQLSDCWQSVLKGHCCFTLVEGEAGIGKNRLVKSFLDAASSQHLVTILKGRCSERVPTAYQPFAEIVRHAVSEDIQQTQETSEPTSTDLRDLSLLVPELADQLAVSPQENQGDQIATQGRGAVVESAFDGRACRERLFESIAQLLERTCFLTSHGPSGDPVVLLLSELQWAPGETSGLLGFLVRRLAQVPIWILATYSPDSSQVWPLPSSADEKSISRIVLDRLEPESVEEITSALVGDDPSSQLSNLLIQHAEGLPLAIAEWINCLWDECVLAYDDGRWRLRDSLTDRSGGLEALIQKRLQRLPTSTRRLAAQAAIMGQKFDARLLTEAAKEHPQVVEVGLELMLERWLIRQHSELWRSGRRERDIVLWAQGARLGGFEFNHRLIWQAILDDIDPRRRQVMHQEIAKALEKNLEQDVEPFCETLAFHYERAGEWERAIGFLRQATQKAYRISALDTARHYGRQAVHTLDRLCQPGREAQDSERWQQQREQATATLATIDKIDRQGP